MSSSSMEFSQMWKLLHHLDLRCQCSICKFSSLTTNSTSSSFLSSNIHNIHNSSNNCTCSSSLGAQDSQ